MSGFTGMTGFTGIQGPQGNAGTIGFQGPTGLNGPQGEEGTLGPKGIRGATGPPGQGANPVYIQHFFGSTIAANDRVTGDGSEGVVTFANRTLETPLPSILGGKLAIPFMEFNPAITGLSSTSNILVPSGTYLIRAYAGARSELSNSYINLSSITSSGGAAIYTELLRGTNVIGNTSHICDTYTFLTPTNTVLRQSGTSVTPFNGGELCRLNPDGPNVGITFVKLQ
jgi:hypothetical protein